MGKSYRSEIQSINVRAKRARKFNFGNCVWYLEREPQVEGGNNSEVKESRARKDRAEEPGQTPWGNISTLGQHSTAWKLQQKYNRRGKYFHRVFKGASTLLEAIHYSIRIFSINITYRSILATQKILLLAITRAAP